MNSKNSKYAIVGIFSLLWGSPLQAQRVMIDAALRTSDRAYVQATGESTLSIKPDVAIIHIGVVTQGATPAAVATQNAKQTDAVLADLRKLLSMSAQLKTAAYSVGPNYQSSKPGAPLTITSYNATNIVEVTLDDVAQVGKAIDAVLQSGASTIKKLQFGLKNPQAARSQVLREAAVLAKSNAEAIAAGLGVHVLRVLSAEEYEPGEDFGMFKKVPPPPPPTGAMPTQIEVGAIEIQASVTLKVEVAQ